MPEKSHTNPQVTIDHAEYQELLEAQKALEHLTIEKGDEEVRIIHQYSDVHSKSNYDKRDFYLVVNPDELTKKLIEHLEVNAKRLGEMHEILGRSYDLPGGRSQTITGLLKELTEYVKPKTK